MNARHVRNDVLDWCDRNRTYLAAVAIAALFGIGGCIEHHIAAQPSGAVASLDSLTHGSQTVESRGARTETP